MLDVVENKIWVLQEPEAKSSLYMFIFIGTINFKRKKLMGQNKNSEIVWVTVAKDFEEHEYLSVKYS